MDSEKKTKALSWLKGCVEFLVAVATIGATIVAMSTLYEMRAERNKAFEPDIVIETKTAIFTWGDPSELLQISDVDIAGDSANKMPLSLQAINIGAGVAKNVKISFPHDTWRAWVESLKSYYPDKEYSVGAQRNAVPYVKLDGNIFSARQSPYEKTYLLPSAEERFDFFLPMLHHITLNHVLEISNDCESILTPIFLDLSFNDAQGIPFEKRIELSIEITGRMTDGPGKNGYTIFKLIAR